MYQAAEDRYDTMEYRRCGRSGLKLPRIALGLWQNFGLEKTIVEQEEILCHAFDRGITHFDLANNYGHPANGLAEKNFGQALKDCLGTYRDELVISTKAGYGMWPGPYGNWGSRKYLMASLDQSLTRMGLDYVDIFYHHRPDPETPLEETMGALSDIVRSGKALYVGLSNYKEEETRKAVRILKENGTPCLIHQPRYNMLERWVEDFPSPYNTEWLTLLQEMDALETPEAKLYKALDNLEAVIQHDESDIASWLPLEYELQLTYGRDKVAFSPYLQGLKAEIDDWTRRKIAESRQ